MIKIYVLYVMFLSNLLYYKSNCINRCIKNNRVYMNMNNNQWNLMKQFHAGRWFGYTTIHDIEDDDDDDNILSSRLTGTSLKLNNDETIVQHINSLHKEYKCMKDIDMNITSLKLSEIVDYPLQFYDSQNITSKFCYNVALSGPNQLKNGDILIQFSIRHNNYRYRILIHYEQFDTITIKGTSLKVPSAGGLTDITISREKIQSNENIIELEGMNKISSLNFDSSILYNIDDFDDDYFKSEKIISSISYNLNEDPREIEEIDLKLLLSSIEENINSLEISDNNNNDSDNIDNDDENDDFINIFPGNFLILCPSIIDSNVSSSICASWIIKRDKVLYQANIKFDSYLDANKKGIKKDSDITQPLLSNFCVNVIKWK